MHPSALSNAKRFFDTYIQEGRAVTVVDIGAQNVNGSLKDVAPSNVRYIGVDFVAAKGVDVILTDPYVLPFESGSIDVVVSSSCLEHSEMFWVVFLEILRILKSDGLFFMNVPSNGWYHRYPVDCWRFYPDSGQALVTWARRNGVNAECLESYTSDKERDVWNDYIAIFLKDASLSTNYPKRICEGFAGFRNGRTSRSEKILNFHMATEDHVLTRFIQFHLWYRFIHSGLTSVKERYWSWRRPRR